MRLDTPVVTRRVPMTSAGCDALRLLREDFERGYYEKTGQEINIPFPTAIHLALSELAKIKNLKK